MNPTIVPATRELLERFYGAAPQRTVRALAAVLDGEPICIAGTFFDRERKVLFADMQDRMREQFPKTGVRLAKRLMRDVAEAGTPAFAIADADVEASARFLLHLGLRPLREGVFAWQA